MRLECAVGADERCGGRGAEQRPVLRQHEMHADGERGPRSRERDGVLERGARRHDRRRGHDAAVVRVDDAAVDGLGDPEVVGVDDQLEPSAHRRSANAQCFMPR